MSSIYPTRKVAAGSYRSLKHFLYFCILGSLISAAGCKQQSPYDITFYDGVQLYDTTQRVMVEIPQGATNVYLTTDNNDPVPNAKCLFVSGVIKVDRPMVIKLRYDIDNYTVNQTGIYVIQDKVRKSQYGNHVAINIFEEFIRNHLNPMFGPTPQNDETKTIEDGMGGAATRTTIIEGIFNITGYQNVAFNNYKYHDPKNNSYFVATSGRISGSATKNGGSFGTLPANGGERLIFTGTYSGNADGQFNMRSGR